MVILVYLLYRCTVWLPKNIWRAQGSSRSLLMRNHVRRKWTHQRQSGTGFTLQSVASGTCLKYVLRFIKLQSNMNCKVPFLLITSCCFPFHYRKFRAQGVLSPMSKLNNTSARISMLQWTSILLNIPIN